MQYSTAVWTPIADGELAIHARRAVVEIADGLARHRDGLGHDLADGAAGIALLFGYLARIEGDPRYRAIAEELLDGAVERLAEAPTSPSLFHGFTGVAWAGDHLRALLGEPALELGDDIDEALLVLLEGPDARAHGFDVVSGLVGIGVHALERRGCAAADRCLALVIDQLADEWRVTRWLTRPERLPPELRARWPDGYHDLGLAHGIPGVIAFFARCTHVPSTRAILDDAVRWLLARRRDDIATRFPSCEAPDRPVAAARSGWCYGDAGIALALELAADALDAASRDATADTATAPRTTDGRGPPRDAGSARRSITEVAREEARALAVRASLRPLAETGVLDASLCHGAASQALIYARLFARIGDLAMRDAARAWTERMLAYRLDDDALAATAGFGRPAQSAALADRSWMNGAAGIALVLLAMATAVEPAWDRALLLSI